VCSEISPPLGGWVGETLSSLVLFQACQLWLFPVGWGRPCLSLERIGFPTWRRHTFCTGQHPQGSQIKAQRFLVELPHRVADRQCRVANLVVCSPASSTQVSLQTCTIRANFHDLQPEDWELASCTTRTAHFTVTRLVRRI
jgi:hypothetical protein